uniref:Uncharacterized protein n=1 Tax=Glossina palpalis gambiensis TaxID=67801 RepID=A0A1B0C2U3_9MUSC
MSYEDDYHVDTFPKEYGYGAFDQEGLDSADMGGADTDLKPRILLMGLRRSGKSSIQKVVFHKMSPNETLFLESTSKIIKDDINNSSFVQFSIWDFPGQIDFIDPTFDSDMIFGNCGSLVFVIDAKDDYNEALTKFKNTVNKAYKRDIHQRASDDLAEVGLTQIHLSFHLTSIYDHSIFEAFSKVVQKLIPQLPTLENLLNIFISNSGIEKAFLFDVVSKIYIATDCSPVDMQSYELCCDMIDVVIDLSSIYSSEETAFDQQSSSLIKLNNNTILCLREVNKFLALVCILREENFNRQGVIDYNFLCFREAISEVFELRLKTQKLPTLDERAELIPNGLDDINEDDVGKDDKIINRTNKII